MFRSAKHIYTPESEAEVQNEGYTFNAKSRDSFSINITLWEKLRRNAASLEEVYSSIIVNEAWASFRDILQQCIDKHAPLISMKVKDRLCPWLTPDVKKEINIRDGLLRKARRTNKKTIGLLLNGNTIEYLAWLKNVKADVIEIFLKIVLILQVNFGQPSRNSILPNYPLKKVWRL